MARRDQDDWLFQVGTELQRLGEELSLSTKAIARRKGWEPRIDLFHTEDGILIRAELAGVVPEDLRITVDTERNLLTIRGQRRDDSDEVARGVQILEIPHGEFSREINLPSTEIAIDSMRATFKNGMLEIVAPFAQDQLSTTTFVRRRILIRSF